uniref:Uncharacterized protein n=1 Tax=Trypanosoma congolense (strain IL3000) TaxID=1068625 RepID=G0UVR6_TRYCI|nr:conserved hypothetical protein [Trypanosoma congolense IL3000]
MAEGNAQPASDKQSPSRNHLSLLAEIEGDVQMRAAQLGLLSSEYRANISRVLYHYEPRVANLQAIVYASEHRRRAIERELVWLERIITLQERRSTQSLLPMRDVVTIEKEILLPIESRLKEWYQKVQNVTSTELSILRNYECPPRQAVSTMKMLMLVRGEDDLSWENVQVVLSENYFFTFFVSRMQKVLQNPLSSGVEDELEKYCIAAEHSPEALAVVSVPLGVIGGLLHAINDYYGAKKLMKLPTQPLTIDERRKRVAVLRDELLNLREDANVATEEISKLKSSIAARFSTVRNEYDDTMCPLHEDLEKKTEDFLRALSRDFSGDDIAGVELEERA